MRPFCGLFVLIVGLGVSSSVRGQDDPKKLAQDAATVLKTHCYRCHSGEGSSNEYKFDMTKHETLVKGIDGEPPIVVANSLTKSPLWDAIQKRMPQRGSQERDTFGDPQRAILKKWIEAGAPAFPESVARDYIPLKTILTLIRDDLAKPANRDARVYLRYFSLVNIHNEARVSEEELRYHRAALSKVLNSLSWKSSIVVPRALDKQETVFAIDLRDLDWEGGTQWRMLIEKYPYGLRYGNHPDMDLRDLDREIRDYTKAEMGWLRADWFVATASRGELYYNLLGIPKDAKVLEEKLGVNIPDNFLKDKLARAGFQKSGVSGQNRLLERHNSKYGFYWKSYDFLPDSGRANLVRFPLGPLNMFPKGKHSYAGQAFNHDGGEIIFALPNGLQGYMLINGKDDRIDVGPIDVVSDDKMTSGTPVIANAISCMACHRHGMIPFKDQIRDGAAVFGDAEEKVKRHYLQSKDMDKLVEKDRNNFLSKLEEATGPFLKVGADKDKKITEFQEPVTVVANYYRPYRRAHLDIKAIATELYLQKPEDLLIKIGEKRLKELGLQNIGKPNGLVGRSEWEATDEGNSLMQEVARELQFTPFGK